MGYLFEIVYKEYKDRVYSYIFKRINCKDGVEDLCEDVFIKLFTFFDNYDDSKSSVSTIIYKIAHDKVIDYYRTHKEHSELTENSAILPTSEEIVMDRLKAEQIRIILETLPSEQRDVIILRFFFGYQLTDIAEKMGVPYSTVIGRQKSALKTLRGSL